MKNISKYLSVALLLIGASCSKTQEGTYYTPNKDDAKEIHFIQSSVEKEFPQESKTGTIDVQIARTGNKGTYTIALTKNGNDEQLFETPSEVTIPDGEYSVTVPVKVDLNNCTVGSSYKTMLYISGREAGLGDSGAQVSQFKDKMTISASFELEWETCYRTTADNKKIPQLASYTYKLYYTGTDRGLEVEKAVGANIYRVKDWASGVNFKFIVHDDNTCTVPAQSIGYYHSTYNEYVFVADMAVYSNDESLYSSYPCTFDGKDTYTFYLIYYVSGGYFGKGEEKLVFDSDPDTTPVVEIAFDGIETTSTGFRAPKLSFSPNSYTKYYKATVVDGDITANTTRQAEVREQLIEDKVSGSIPLAKLYEEDQSIWNVPAGNYTAVALAYDSIENPCKLYTKRFTCDPENQYAVKAHVFEWYSSQTNPTYSPYTTLYWDIQTSNVVSARYFCVTADIADYLTEYYGQTIEEITATRGTVIPEEMIALMNSDDGYGSVFNTLDEGTTYILTVVMTNQFGDSLSISKTASTPGHFAADFDQTKTMQDFLGAFNATATVTSGSTDTKTSYRIDISRLKGTAVLLDGVSSMRDFTPRLSGYYDEQKHMIIIEPQSAGMYEGNYVMLGLTNGLSLFWGGNSMGIGYIGDKLYWAASPYATDNVNGYMFLLFNSPQASSSSYLREYVGSLTYTAISMEPLVLEPTAKPAAAKAIERNTATFKAGDRTIVSYLMQQAGSAAAVNAAAPAAASQPAGKTLRTDLVLHAH